MTRLVDRLPIIALALWIVSGIWGLGNLLWRCASKNCDSNEFTSNEASLASLAIGTAAWGTLTLVLGRLGLLNQTLWIVLPLVFLSVGLYLRRKLTISERLRAGRAFIGLIPWPAWPFVIIMILASMLPTIDFDCIEYHLQGPKEYWQAGRIHFLPHNIYTNMPFGVEMLHTSAMSMAGDWKTGALTGQLLIGLHPLLVAGLIQVTCRRWGNADAGWWGALIYLTIPWTYRLAAIPYVEGPLCAAMIGWLWAVSQAWNHPSVRRWLVVGLFAGWAMSCKYTAILPVVVPTVTVVAYITFQRKNIRPFLGVLLGGSLIFGPWLVKNVVDTGNPVYPLAWNVFGGIDRDAQLNAKWSAAHGRKAIEVRLLWQSVVDVAGRSDWQSPLLLAFAPLALFVPKVLRVQMMWIAVLAAWIFLSWWLFTHRLDRFWLPIQPILALLAGLGVTILTKKSRAGAIWCHLLIAFSLAMNWIYCSTALAGLNEWTQPLERLWRTVPNRLYPASVLVDQTLGKDDKVLLVGQAAVFYWEHPILYNTVFNREGIEVIAGGRTSAEIHKILKEKRVTHLFVDWSEINRYRQPGNYGFTDFVTQEFFDRLVKDGVLGTPTYPAPLKTLYTVRD